MANAVYFIPKFFANYCCTDASKESIAVEIAADYKSIIITIIDVDSGILISRGSWLYRCLLRPLLDSLPFFFFFLVLVLLN